MNIKQIINDNGIETVYSVYYGVDIPSDGAIFSDLHENGSAFIGGECLIFPSKEERNWDRFNPKEPNYKQCESIEQFADLFLGAKVKRKEGIGFRIVVTIENDYDLSYWFYNYTLLDGTPLGIKCDE